ncbi:MAG: hypothetical protein ABW133_13575 [Polyangiaceae bacterium]
MLRSLLVALGAALGLFAFASLGEAPGGAAMRAALGVALGVGVASLAYGEATFAAVAVGAVSPLALAALEPTSLAVAATAMCALWIAPRFVLAESRRKLATLALASLFAATIAGVVLAGYVTAPIAAHAASCVFAGSCLSLVGIVVPLPSPHAYTLRSSAAIIGGPSRETLLAAADAFESSRWHPRGAGEGAKWRKLVRLSDQRAALERASGPRAEDLRRELDAQIAASSEELLPKTAADPADVAQPADSAQPADVAVAPVAPVTTVEDAIDVTVEPSQSPL